MKIALIADTHFGARNDNTSLQRYFIRFLDEIFFPHLTEHNIDTVIHLGDLVDKRKNISYLTLNGVRKEFIERLDWQGSKTHFIVGNHDTYYKNTNQINSINELFAGIPDITVYDKATTVNFDGVDICMLPWLCQDNLEESMRHVEETTAQIAMAHLELTGFNMQKGVICPHGSNKKDFQKFDIVMSGHFHYKSDDGHIYYLGNPYEMMWSDYGVQKGFHIFDTDTSSLEFIDNPYKMFHRINYDDSDKELDEILDQDFSIYENAYIKVVVVDKTNPFLFDRYIDALQKVEPTDISIIEEFDVGMEDGDVEFVEDTLTILDNYLDSKELDVDKSKVKSVIRSVYNEAISIE
jgi:DNA repair exonuclease SbcCD nuclease subunit